MKKKNLLMTAVAIIGFATITIAQPVPSYVPTNGLVSWYPFNGNANDVSGNGKNGTIYGGVTLTTDRFGNPNNSYYFNGTTGSILADTFYVSNNFTASFWYLASSSINLSVSNTQANSGSTILCKGASNNPCNYADFAFGFKNGNYGPGELNCSNNSWFETELGWGCSYTYVSNCNSNISLQYNWTNLTIVLSFGYLKRYSNGILIDSIAYTAHSGLLANSGYPLSIGGRYVANNSMGTSGFWMGKLDDIGIWNRALTQLEISALYNGCTGTAVTTQPINQSVNISNNAQFTTASSDSMATYQWQTDLGVGFQDLNSVGQYIGTANDTLTIANTTLTNNNQPFRCIISSGSCTDTSAVAILTVVNNVGINEIYQSSLFSVYPNPANSQINMKADAKLLGSVYTIYDNTGKLVLTGKINSDNTVIELDNLSGGIYLFSVGENMKQTFKVIKE